MKTRISQVYRDHYLQEAKTAALSQGRDVIHGDLLVKAEAIDRLRSTRRNFWRDPWSVATAKGLENYNLQVHGRVIRVEAYAQAQETFAYGLDQSSIHLVGGDNKEAQIKAWTRITGTLDPAWGLKNFWINEGHSFGITAAGGAGWQLAEWIVDGEPTIDMLGVEPRRYGNYATKSYLKAKNEEAYSHVFIVHYPDEERPAARPLRTAPCYERMKALGAVFGQKFGWERPNFFATDGMEQKDDWSFRRSKWFDAIKKECENVKKNVGLLDMTAFAKCRIKGPKAEEFLDYLVANKLPKKIGRINLCHALNTKGGVHSEFTIMKEAENSYYLVSAGANLRLDHDWIQKWMPTDGSVIFEDLTNSTGVLVVAGPKARQLMQKVSTDDFSNENFKWLTAKNVNVGYAPVNAMRVNFVGELGWELHHPIEYQNHIFDKLMEAGKDLGIKPFGIRAMNSLRIEKSYKLVGTELSIEYSPYESGLDRFVHPNKGNFIGLEALNKWREKGFDNKLVTLEVHNTTDSDVLGNNPIYKDDKVVGRATGGEYGFRIDKSIALAMVKPDLANVGEKLKVDILGKMYEATILEESPYDSENKLLRA